MSKRILLIDSDEHFAAGLQSAINARGFFATTATNSEQGMTLARQDSPDLIVVCVEAQPTNGYMLCTRLKKDEQLKGIPVILTSANATPDSFEKHKKLKTRAEEYLIKPFEPQVMLQKVSEMLGVPLQPLAEPQHEEIVSMEDEPLGLGDLVQGEDEPIHLTDSEAAAAHAGGDSGDDNLVVEEVEEVDHAQVQEEHAAHDDDLQMFDRAFDAIGMPGQSQAEQDKNAFGSLRLAPEPPAEAHEAHEAPHAELSLDPAMEPQAEAAVEHVPEQAEAAGYELHADAPPMSFDDESTTVDALPPMPAVDHEAHAALEARVHQLEEELASRTAELEASRKSAASTGELLKLKEAKTRADKEVLRLKEEFNAKEKELLELQEQQHALESQAQALKDEAVKREAAAKALQQRAEALAAAAKKFERELSSAREELKALPALKARAAELEKISAAHGELQKKHADVAADLDRHKQLVPELEKHKVRASELETELQGARELHETELSGARELHETELREARELHETAAAQLRTDLGNAQQEAARHAEEASSAREELDKLRTEHSALTGEKELIHEEREELRGKHAEAEAAAARNEERAVKAYQKIKADERLREKTRKALQTALQHLDENAGAETDQGPEKQSA